MEPKAWLGQLAQVLSQGKAKVAGKECSLERALQAVQDTFIEVRSKNKAVWWVGNGGSSALCSHLSQDLLNKLKMRSQSMSDVSLLTCMANDFGYEQVYARPLETLAQEGDLLIAVSSSGKSKNILNCVELTKRKKMPLISLSAFEANNPLWQMSDCGVSFYLNCDLYGLVEVGHEALLHSAIETLFLKEKR